jgi:DNA-binding LacI/PurR family transcriptional regulator
MKDGHVTVYDVAKRAGVSAATVSRALTGTKVKNKNQEKIRQAALDLGYVPNTAARSLRRVRTMTVGAVFHRLSSALGIELISALASGLEKRGYSLFVSTAQGDNDKYGQLVHRFLERRVDALLCIHGAGSGVALDRFIAANIPVVALISKSDGYQQLPLVEPSIQQAGKACVARLKALKHRRVYVLHPDRRTPPVNEFAEIASRAKLLVENQNIKGDSFNAEEFLKRLTRTPNAPTVIAAPHAEAAQLCLAADRLSIQIPKELSIVAIRDRSLQVPATRLALSIINLDPSIIGSVAAELIADQIAGNLKLKKKMAVEIGAWVERDTLGPASR